MDDLISRQAAIEKIREYIEPYNNEDAIYGACYNDGLDMAIALLSELSSAQPEPLTYAEQRVFLKAISREKKVCKKTDEEYSGAINLVGVCNEIERKVKGTLWT